ncbi:MAG: hypothetical protein KF768_04410 [Phycisphaeraceae bacterium]|nr:hypothetical protein [Phycisphaeraceae bacterium]
MARVEALSESSKKAPPKPEGLDKAAKVKIGIAAAMLLVAFVIFLAYLGVFSSPHDNESTAAPELTQEEQQELRELQQRNPIPDPDAPITDPANPPPVGS